MYRRLLLCLLLASAQGHRRLLRSSNGTVPSRVAAAASNNNGDALPSSSADHIAIDIPSLSNTPDVGNTNAPTSPLAPPSPSDHVAIDILDSPRTRSPQRDRSSSLSSSSSSSSSTSSTPNVSPQASPRRHHHDHHHRRHHQERSDSPSPPPSPTEQWSSPKSTRSSGSTASSSTWSVATACSPPSSPIAAKAVRTLGECFQGEIRRFTETASDLGTVTYGGFDRSGTLVDRGCLGDPRVLEKLDDLTSQEINEAVAALSCSMRTILNKGRMKSKLLQDLQLLAHHAAMMLNRARAPAAAAAAAAAEDEHDSPAAAWLHRARTMPDQFFLVMADDMVTAAMILARMLRAACRNKAASSQRLGAALAIAAASKRTESGVLRGVGSDVQELVAQAMTTQCIREWTAAVDDAGMRAFIIALFHRLPKRRDPLPVTRTAVSPMNWSAEATDADDDDNDEDGASSSDQSDELNSHSIMVPNTSGASRMSHLHVDPFSHLPDSPLNGFRSETPFTDAQVRAMRPGDMERAALLEHIAEMVVETSSRAGLRGLEEKLSHGHMSALERQAYGVIIRSKEAVETSALTAEHDDEDPDLQLMVEAALLVCLDISEWPEPWHLRNDFNLVGGKETHGQPWHLASHELQSAAEGPVDPATQAQREKLLEDKPTEKVVVAIKEKVGEEEMNKKEGSSNRKEKID